MNATLAEIKTIQQTVAQYIVDTGQFPPMCNQDCTESTDPFLHPLGVLGWNGPYMAVHNKSHPWGGHIGVWNEDVDLDGIPDYVIALNDDRPGTNVDDDSAPIPTEALEMIDAKLDDGDLSTGHAIGDGMGFLSVRGELVIKQSDAR